MGLICGISLSLVVALASQQPAAPANAVAAPRAQAPAAQQPPAQPRLGPFKSARLAPPDAKVFLHVERAGRLRRELATRPIARWLGPFTNDSAVAKSWSTLAQSLQMDEGSLFDACFGREFTYIGRGEGEWAVITEFAAGDEPRFREMLRTLQVRVREPSFGMAVSELPEQEVFIASDGGVVVIGPVRQPGAFYEVLQRWGARDNAVDVLASDPAFMSRLGELKCDAHRADIAAFVRHERPLGGCSMIVADIRGDDVEIKHAGRFDNPLLAAPVTDLTCDFSPLNLLADRALVAIMQPRDVGDGPLESFLSADLGVGVISAEMRPNLADRRLLVMGEADARRLPEARDILTTTFVACLEARNGAVAGTQLDDQMARVAKRLNDLGQGAFLVKMPDLSALRPDEARQADLGAAGEWFNGGFPVMRTVSLNWTVANGPDGSAWFVVGSNPQALQETVQALAQPCLRDDRLVGKYDSCGLANGARLGRHLQSWSDQTGEFADAPNQKAVRESLTAFANLAMGVKSCRWQMARPDAHTMRLEAQLRLAPAETAGH